MHMKRGVPTMKSAMTSKDVAKLAGVSQATVSLVMNNHARISPETVLKVRGAARKLGYDPGNVNSRKGHRPKRRRPASYRKMQIALISQIKPMLFHTPVYSKVMHGIEDELGKLDYNLIIRNLPQEAPEKAIPRKVDGVILFHVHAMHESRKLLGKLREIPCVQIMGGVSENEFFDHVTYKENQIGKMAAEHLLSKGHRTLLYFGPTRNYLRHRTFMDAVKAGGASAYQIDGNFQAESREKQGPNLSAIGKAVEELKRLPVLPTAIFTPVDVIVAGLYNVLRKHGLVPGKDVEVVGVNNDRILLDPLDPRPASVDIHAETVGRKAVERLLWRIDNPKGPLERMELEPEIAL